MATERQNNEKEAKMNIEKKMKFDLCWFAGAFAAMGLAFGACLIGTEMMSHGGNGNLQAMVSVALLTVLPFTLAILLAVAAWLARAYRAKLLGACVGFAVAGTVLTCVMLANANRRAAVLDMFLAALLSPASVWISSMH